MFIWAIHVLAASTKINLTLPGQLINKLVRVLPNPNPAGVHLTQDPNLYKLNAN